MNRTRIELSVAMRVMVPSFAQRSGIGSVHAVCCTNNVAQTTAVHTVNSFDAARPVMSHRASYIATNKQDEVEC